MRIPRLGCPFRLAGSRPEGTGSGRAQQPDGVDLDLDAFYRYRQRALADGVELAVALPEPVRVAVVVDGVALQVHHPVAPDAGAGVLGQLARDNGLSCMFILLRKTSFNRLSALWI